MTIKIKPGDIVRYCGEIVRVLQCNIYASEFRLSHFGWIGSESARNLELVESIPDTTLKNGDEVIIHDIPGEEKYAYGVLWLDDMENMMISGKVHTIDYIKYSDKYGWIGRIGGYNFQLYHIESANNFDMI